MGWASILALLDGGEADGPAAGSALAVAAALDARVDGLIVRPDPREAVRLAIDGMSPAMIESVIDAARAESTRRIAQARASFEIACGEAGFEIGDDGRAGWHEEIGLTADQIANRGRMSDLVVTGHVGGGAGDDSDIAIETVLFETPRPLLLVGRTPFETKGLRAVIAWNGSRESALAASASLPLLAGAAAVTVLEVNGEGLRGPDGKAAVDYLARHRVQARAELINDADKPVAQTILEAARERGAGLLVMGAYGHSRLRELVLGGVTRQVLVEAGLPVLMIH